MVSVVLFLILNTDVVGLFIAKTLCPITKQHLGSHESHPRPHSGSAIYGPLVNQPAITSPYLPPCSTGVLH